MDIRPIIQTYQRPLISIACRMLGCMEEAKDAVQETFVRFWKKQPEIKGDPFSLLCRILMNYCIDQLRKRQFRKLFSIEGSRGANTIQSDDDPHKVLEKAQLMDCVRTAADRLKPVQKAVFLLRDVEDYSIKEITDLTGYAENNIRVNLHLARRNMRKWLRPLLNEELG